MKNKVLLLLTAILFSCNTAETDYQVKKTVSNLAASLAAAREAEFKNLIIPRPANMPEDLHYDLLHRLYNRSTLIQKMVDPELIEANNHMGQTVYRVPFFHGRDSLTGITDVNLILYFGPKDIFPKDKLSEFETEIKYDTELRRKILEEKFNVELK